MNHVFKAMATTVVACTFAFCCVGFVFLLFFAFAGAMQGDVPAKLGPFFLVWTAAAGFLSLILGQRAAIVRVDIKPGTIPADDPTATIKKPTPFDAAREAIDPRATRPPVRPAAPAVRAPLADDWGIFELTAADRETEKLRRRMNGGA